MPSKAPAKAKGALVRKVGPLPVWGWAVAVVVLVIAYSKLKGGGSRGGSADTTGGLGATQSSAAQPQSPTSAAADSAGVSNSSLANILGYEDNLNSNLVGGILGSQQALVDVNSNLVGGLMNANNGIIGLGETALGYNGQLEQAIIDGMAPTAPATVQSPSSTAPVSSSQFQSQLQTQAAGIYSPYVAAVAPAVGTSQTSYISAVSLPSSSTAAQYAPLLRSTMIGTY